MASSRDIQAMKLCRFYQGGHCPQQSCYYLHPDAQVGRTPRSLSGAKTAWDLLSEEKSRSRIVTSCDELNTIFGGGICLKEVTEICGAPGVGKTQLGIQLAINVQIPTDFGGLNGQAVYIDTEGSFMVERAMQMAEGCIARLHDVAAGNCKTLGPHLNIDWFLSHIFYFRVKIIVIDSVTFHFRHGFDDMALRTRLLGGMGQKLMRCAEMYDVAIVQMNQVTTRFAGGSARLVPALGETWSHACTNRVILYWSNGQRHAFMYKSPSLRSASAPFDITSEGLCSVGTNKRLKYKQ
eukprot:c17750_g1_i2 orf=624-1505(-)